MYPQDSASLFIPLVDDRLILLTSQNIPTYLPTYLPTQYPAIPFTMDRATPLPLYPEHDSSLSLATPNTAEVSATPPDGSDNYEEMDDGEYFNDNDKRTSGRLP